MRFLELFVLEDEQNNLVNMDLVATIVPEKESGGFFSSAAGETEYATLYFTDGESLSVKQTAKEIFELIKNL